MPIIKSAIKRAKQEQVRRARNTVTKQQLRRATKALESAVDAKDAKKASDALSTVYGALDTAAKKNVIHANKASRKKARYTKAVAAIGGSMATTTKAKAKPVAKKPATKKPVAKKAPATKPAAKKAPAKKPAVKK